MKLDATGNIVWQKSLGENEDDFAYSIQQTTDGGFIVAGNYNSGIDSGGYFADYWIVKLGCRWKYNLAKNLWVEVMMKVLIPFNKPIDGGFIIAGSSNSNDGDVSGNHGNYDYWVVKLGTIATGYNTIEQRANSHSSLSQSFKRVIHHQFANRRSDKHFGNYSNHECTWSNDLQQGRND